MTLSLLAPRGGQFACPGPSGRKGRTGSGFSLVELMVVLAVMAVLLGVAVPGFVGLLGKTRLTTAVNDFLAAVKATRSEALGRGARVDMVPNDGKSWASGWTVFVDADHDQLPDEGEAIIARRSSLPSDVRVSTEGAGNGFYDARAKKTYVAFNAAGYVTRNSGASGMDSFILYNAHASRKITLAFLGRARSCDPKSDTNC